MKKFLSSGLALFAGMVSLPARTSFREPQTATSRDYGQDPRLLKLKDFFGRTECPAEAYSSTFLEAADALALDWRLLPSISFVESTGGKSARGNNVMGWDSGQARFLSPAAAIHSVAWRITHSGRYRNKGIDGILATYNSSAAYARKVKSVMRRIAPPPAMPPNYSSIRTP